MAEDNEPRIQINPEKDNINSKEQNYAQRSLKYSNVMSAVSHNSTAQNLVVYFQNYKCCSSHFNLPALCASDGLKLKKYKQCVYYGQFKEGHKQGQGIMVYNSGRIYEGNWKQDLKDSYGFQKFPNSCVYEGNYANGKPHGVGKYTWPNGEIYQGQWSAGLKHGTGMWKGPKGDSYIGEWSNGNPHGYGVHIWVNGDRYEGQFQQSLKHGEGIQRFTNGDIFKGQYQKGKSHGFGEYYWSNGNYYKGTFKEGLRQGQGIWKRNSGSSDKYEGEYVQDKKQGYGIYSWQNGDVYKGNYIRDIRQGYGQMYWKDCSFYKGSWKKGVQDGLGQIYVVGEGFKRGTFHNNVLVQVDHESSNYLSNQQVNLRQQPQKYQQPKNKEHHSETYHSNSKQIQHSKVTVYILKQPGRNTLAPHNHTKIPPRTLNKTINVNASHKERPLHSAFYLHKMHNPSINDKKLSKAGHVSVMSGAKEPSQSRVIKRGGQYLVRRGRSLVHKNC